MKVHWKTMVFAIAATVAIGGASDVLAEPVFTINPLAVPEGTSPRTGSETQFLADNLSGMYNERIVFASPGSLSGEGWWLAAADQTEFGAPLPAAITGIGVDYNLYLTFQFTALDSGNTYNLTSLSFSIYADPNTDNTFTSTTTATPPSISNTADDILLATGILATGTSPPLEKNWGVIAFNDFEQISLTNFFAAPTPFYTMAVLTLDPASTSTSNPPGCTSFPCTVAVNGTGNLTFIPEPATLALLGVGLAGIGFARRRRLN